MSMPPVTLKSQPSLSPSQIADLRLAASQLTGPKRRAFEAEMTLKYCGGNSLMAEAVFGWGRQTVARGLGERRTGIICLGAQAAFSGRKRWEDQPPHVAQALRQLAEAHAHQDPTHSTELRGGGHPAHRKPPDVRICRLSIQSDVGTRPPSTSTPHLPAFRARCW